VPGRPGDPSVAGCLAFLREAGPEARIVAGVAELLEDLGLLAPNGPRPVPASSLLGMLTGVEAAVAGHVAEGLASVDELVAATGAASAAVLRALTSLEVRGLVVEAFGLYRAAGPLAAEGGGKAPAIPGAAARRRRRAA
jgi:predicted Rossmann fold nucleotide-binding protein DprA/Smf involved in DNA uptake